MAIARNTKRKESSAEIQRLVNKFKRSGDTLVYEALHKRFEGFINKQVGQLVTLFPSIATRADALECANNIFVDAIMNYTPKVRKKWDFLPYVTKELKYRTRDKYRVMLRKGVANEYYGGNKTEGSGGDTGTSMDVDRDVQLLECFRTAKTANLTTLQAMVLGAMFLGKGSREIGDELGVDPCKVRIWKGRAITKLKAVGKPEFVLDDE